MVEFIALIEVDQNVRAFPCLAQNPTTNLSRPIRDQSDLLEKKMENVSLHENNTTGLSGNPSVPPHHGARGPPPSHPSQQPQPATPTGPPGPMMPQGPPQLPPQMFTTAAQLQDLTDSEEHLSLFYSLIASLYAIFLSCPLV